MYGNSKAVQCVAECLVNLEINTQKYSSCDLRNAARLVAHVGCYTKCGFIPDPRKGVFGLPNGDSWKLGIGELIPAFISVGTGGTNIE